MSTDVVFFETTPFSLSSTVTSQGDDDGLLVYTDSSPDLTLALALIFTASTPALVKPPIT